MNLRWIAASLVPPAFAAALAAGLAWGCGTTSAPSPFFTDAGKDGSGEGGAGGSSSGAGAGGGGGGADAGDGSMLGGPCLDDGQCTGMVSCTFNSCDKTVGRCRFTPDDSKCQDGVYCNGVERCDPTHGCVPGVPVGCDDGNSCTIDTCVESSQSCTHVPRDADGDGDPDDHCGGHDCDDNNPNVNSHHPEVCANGIDDNCNGKIDEMPCVSPQNDTCNDPLVISASGTYPMTTIGCKLDYPTSCGLGTMPGAGDVVAAVTLPAGPPVDLEVTARTMGQAVSVAVAGQCGDPSTELCCGAAFSAAQGGQIARAVARGLGSASQMTAYPVYVATAPGATVSLDVQILPATPAPTNETCGTAAPITPGTPVTAEILDTTQNVGSACSTQLGELVYTFTLASPSDVDVYASSTDGDAEPMVSLRDTGCALPSDEITCLTATTAHLHRKELAAGTYYIAVSATAPDAVDLSVELSPPTTPASDQFCTGAPVITPNKTIPVQLSTHEDAVELGCLPGAVNAAYELDLAAASDVLLVERIAGGDTGWAGLATPACTAATALLCKNDASLPLRASKRGVPAGQYRVLAGSLLGEDVELTAFVRDAVPPTLVPFANGCSGAFPIPPTGGFFQGNTANAAANFPTGCDNAGVTGNGAPDQLLVLTLTATQRVVLDMEGSAYNTILDVRQGPSCPGTEVAMACAVGWPPDRSYLDLTLPAGTYYVQIDGFEYASGPWFLDVRVVDP